MFTLFDFRFVFVLLSLHCSKKSPSNAQFTETIVTEYTCKPKGSFTADGLPCTATQHTASDVKETFDA